MYISIFFSLQLLVCELKKLINGKFHGVARCSQVKELKQIFYTTSFLLQGLIYKIKKIKFFLKFIDSTGVVK